MASNTPQSGFSQKWEGRWDQFTGKIKQIWGAVTDDELQKAQGDYERVIGLLKEKTGETREKIEERLNA
jgi:uncharacterized protein YjbJ (UPF0337 family)